jgi:predicted TIM-barrel fold metal-dependent hydrolase
LKQELDRLLGENPLEDGDVGDLVETLDRRGIERAWLLSCAYMKAADVWSSQKSRDSEQDEVAAENDFTAQQASQHGERISAFLSVNPKREYAVEEIDRCVDEHGMVGLKLHCWNSLVDVRNSQHLRKLRKVLDRAQRRRLPVLVHAFNGQVQAYGRRDIEIWTRELIEPLDQLRVCFAHLGGAGGFFAPIQETFAALVDLLGPESEASDRVVVDLSAVLMGPNTLGMPETSAAEKQRLAELLDQWGCDRLLWGSDSLPNALRSCRKHWPLGSEEWSEVCQQSGDVLLG